MPLLNMINEKALDVLPRRAMGWFPAGFSHEFLNGNVRGVQLMDKEVVVWRDHMGEIHVHSAFCPHLGAHLQDATVVDDMIVCPFHSHAFSAEGERVGNNNCNERLIKWPVQEKNGYIFVYYGESEPSWEIPDLNLSVDEWGAVDDSCSITLRMNTHPQEMHENNVDIAHFRPTHDFHEYESIEPYAFKEHEIYNKFCVKQVFLRVNGKPFLSVRAHMTFILRGLGFAQVFVETHKIYIGNKTINLAADKRPNVCVFFATRYDKDGTTILFSSRPRKTNFIKKLPRGIGNFLHSTIASLIFRRATIPQLQNDKRLWENKSYITTPLVDRLDGPIIEYREWCKKWYLG